MLTDGRSLAAFHISAVAQCIADYDRRQSDHVIAGVCQSVCLSVCLEPEKPWMEI